VELIIVVTTADYDLWENAKDERNWSEETIEDIIVRWKKFNGNKVLLLCQAKIQIESEKEYYQLVKEETTHRIIQVIQHFQDVDIYIAAHINVVNWNEVRKKVQGERLKGYKDFSHGKSDPVYEVLRDLIIHDNSESYQKLKEILIKLPMINKLSNLKYRIIFLFLPIDIDAQGLIEVGNKAQYWNRENPYTDDILEYLWKRVRELAKNVKQVVNEVKEKASDTEKEKICQAWGKMASLDNDEPPKEVTQIFQDLEQTEPVDLEGLKCHWTQFHNWLVDLCEAMDELRDVVGKVEGRR
jgi:superoxide dismutase